MLSHMYLDMDLSHVIGILLVLQDGILMLMMDFM